MAGGKDTFFKISRQLQVASRLPGKSVLGTSPCAEAKPVDVAASWGLQPRCATRGADRGFDAYASVGVSLWCPWKACRLARREGVFLPGG